VSELAIRRGAAPALAVDGLTYTYPRAAAPALRGVSLEVAPGEFVLLAGRSASGKSTLLRAACGLVPHFHGGEVGGRVEVAGMDAIAAGPGELAAAVGYLAQDPETQVVSTTVAAEIELPLEMRGDGPGDRARAVEEVALALAIPHLLGRAVDTLSGGELQRVALAAALVTRPRLVLLDEPTSQLDPVSGDELIWLLRRLNEEWGVAVVLAEHRLERCLAAADRVVAVEEGRIGFDGSAPDFLAWTRVADPTLTTPAARLFSLAGIEPLPVGVRDARRVLGERGAWPIERDPSPAGSPAVKTPATAVPHPGKGGGGENLPPDRPSRFTAFRKHREDRALAAAGLWVELDDGEGSRDVLRGIDLAVAPGERVALMGRNGAGKSTLLRAAAGLAEAVAGRVAAERMALLTQNPSDYLVRERVGDELPGAAGLAALRAVGMEHAIDADPRDLSGGERQRLALAIALAGRLDGDGVPGLVALDEPTRGMDRGRKDDLVALVDRLAEQGAAVLIATHDVEFAAEFAHRVVLLGDGVVIADGPSAEILSGGWYFATEVARVLDIPGVVTPEHGASHLADCASDLRGAYDRQRSEAPGGEG
jgi:energy-coupling factor transport system ATP-binding protein